MRQKDVDREAKSSTEVSHGGWVEGIGSVFPQPEREGRPVKVKQNEEVREARASHIYLQTHQRCHAVDRDALVELLFWFLPQLQGPAQRPDRQMAAFRTCVLLLRLGTYTFYCL